jgi:hypothetical protein
MTEQVGPAGPIKIRCAESKIPAQNSATKSQYYWIPKNTASRLCGKELEVSKDILNKKTLVL